MMYPPPSSFAVRFLLGTKYVRHYAKRLIRTYQATVGSEMVVSIRTGTDDGLIVREVFDECVYERHFIATGGMVVIDAGANSGFFALRASKLVGDVGQVIAIEPFSKSFLLLEKHIQKNGCKNTIAINTALGSERKTSLLNVYDHPGNNSFYDKRALLGERFRVQHIGSEEVLVDTLDSIASRLGLQRIDICKIDTEGSELEVLKGATRVLRDFHPRIVMETHPYGSLAGEITEFLHMFGYQTIIEPYPNAESLLFSWYN